MVRYRSTGVSWVGVQWERKDDDGEVARRVLNLLGDRRLLWADFSMEVYEDCVASADYIRKELGKHLDNPEISEAFALELRGMQRMFRDFMSEVGGGRANGVGGGNGYGTDALSLALGRLRALVGVQLGHLAVLYGLDVPEDLAAIVPDGGAWFFERFSG